MDPDRGGSAAVAVPGSAAGLPVSLLASAMPRQKRLEQCDDPIKSSWTPRPGSSRLSVSSTTRSVGASMVFLPCFYACCTPSGCPPGCYHWPNGITMPRRGRRRARPGRPTSAASSGFPGTRGQVSSPQASDRMSRGAENLAGSQWPEQLLREWRSRQSCSQPAIPDGVRTG